MKARLTVHSTVSGQRHITVECKPQGDARHSAWLCAALAAPSCKADANLPLC